MRYQNDGAHAPRPIEFIQVLRGLAALAVVVLHAGWDHADYGMNNSVRHALTSGIAGVDLFFVISGFIMYCTLPAGAQRWSAAWRFAAKRFSRIWPPYAAWTLVLVVMILCIPASRLFQPALHVRDLVLGLLFLPTSRHFFPPAFTLPVLDVGWTLYYEAYFYAVLALCIGYGRWKWPLFVVWLVLATLVIPAVRGAPMFAVNVSPGGDLPLLNTLTSPIMLEFAAGVAIGWIYQRNIRFPHVSMGITATVLATMLLGIQCIMTQNIQHGLAGVGFPITLIVLSLALTPMAQHGTWSPLLWLGKVSFSLYLAHKPVILAMEAILSIPMATLKPPALAAFIVGACILSIIIAGLSYRLLEAGLSNRTRDFLLSHPRSSARRTAHAPIAIPSILPPERDA
jgi:exopolysaccharide production protein ExoZ